MRFSLAWYVGAGGASSHEVGLVAVERDQTTSARVIATEFYVSKRTSLICIHALPIRTDCRMVVILLAYQSNLGRSNAVSFFLPYGA